MNLRRGRGRSNYLLKTVFVCDNRRMNRKNIVRAVLGFSLLLSSGAFGLVLSFALAVGTNWLTMSVWALVSFTVFGAVFVLTHIMENKAVILAGVTLVAVMPFLFFEKSFFGFCLISAVFLFLLRAARRTRFEKESRLKFAATAIARKILPAAVVAMAALSALIFYGTPLAWNLSGNIVVPRSLFDSVAAVAAETVLAINLPVGADMKSLPPEFERQQAEFLDKVYISLSEQIAAAARPLEKWFPLGAAISAFFAFKIVGAVLIWPMTFLAWLIFRILLLAGIVKIEKIATEKEVIVMK